LNDYIEENGESNSAADAKDLFAKLEEAKSSADEALATEQAEDDTSANEAAVNAEIAKIMSKLKSKADRLVARNEYESAKAIYDDYSGDYATETQSQRNAATSVIDEKIKEEEQAKLEELSKKRDDYVFAICDGMINKKSYSGLAAFLRAPDVAKFPELKEIISDFAKVKSDIIKKYQKLKGKTVVITVKGKKKKYKITDCDKDKITAGIMMSGKLFKTRINLKDVPVSERVDELDRKAEAIALYCAVQSMSSGEKAEAIENISKSGILASGLSRALGTDDNFEATANTSVKVTQDKPNSSSDSDEAEDLEELEELEEF